MASTVVSESMSGVPRYGPVDALAENDQAFSTILSTSHVTNIGASETVSAVGGLADDRHRVVVIPSGVTGLHVFNVHGESVLLGGHGFLRCLGHVSSIRQVGHDVNWNYSEVLGQVSGEMQTKRISAFAHSASISYPGLIMYEVLRE